jgi:hypothetical protein
MNRLRQGAFNPLFWLVQFTPFNLIHQIPLFVINMMELKSLNSNLQGTKNDNKMKNDN